MEKKAARKISWKPGTLVGEESDEGSYKQKAKHKNNQKGQ